MPGRRRSQRAADRAHAADRHVPVAGAATHQVVEEAHVLPQRRVVGASECSDQCIGRHHAANQIVGDRPVIACPIGSSIMDSPRASSPTWRRAWLARAQRLGDVGHSLAGDVVACDGRTR